MRACASIVVPLAAGTPLTLLTAPGFGRKPSVGQLWAAYRGWWLLDALVLGAALILGIGSAILLLRGRWSRRVKGLVAGVCLATACVATLIGSERVALFTYSPSTLYSSIAAIAPSPQGVGYLLAATNGVVFAKGDLGLHQRTHDGVVDASTVGVSATATGDGYLVAMANGSVIPYGDAGYEGSLPALGQTVSDVIGIAASTNGAGYWLVRSNGAVYAFGAAKYFGGAGALPYGTRVVSVVATPSGGGYWLTTNTGVVYALGDAHWYGSIPTLSPVPNPPVTDIVGMATTPSGAGYWLVGSDGGVFTFGNAPFHGSLAQKRLTSPVVGIACSDTTSLTYSLVQANGLVSTQ